jgi:AmpD protein
LVVIHSISLPPGVYQGNTVIEFLTGQALSTEHPYLDTIKALRVSAHFFIRRQGELIQMVSCDHKAWHAGVSQYRGRDQCNNDSIGIELEGLEGQSFEPEQYETLSSLCASLLAQYPIQHLAGHEHIAPERKKDPGPGFSWDHFQKSLGLSDQFFPDRDK